MCVTLSLCRLGWERVRTPQLRMEIPVPVSTDGAAAAALLRRSQPAGATLAQADCMLPKVRKNVVSLPLSLSLSLPL
eukprot:COSAG03_NODE_1441_length_4076_cov_8.553684_3_plen_77_part_00